MTDMCSNNNNSNSSNNNSNSNSSNKRSLHHDLLLCNNVEVDVDWWDAVENYILSCRPNEITQGDLYLILRHHTMSVSESMSRSNVASGSIGGSIDINMKTIIALVENNSKIVDRNVLLVVFGQNTYAPIDVICYLFKNKLN